MLTRHFPRRILYVYEKSHLSVITLSSPVVGDGSDATESLHFRLSLYSCTYTYIYTRSVTLPVFFVFRLSRMTVYPLLRNVCLPI